MVNKESEEKSKYAKSIFVCYRIKCKREMEWRKVKESEENEK